MKVLFVSYAESHSNKWVNALVKRNHDVIFVMQKSEVNHIENLDNRVKIELLPFTGKKGYFLNAIPLKMIVEKYNPDVVNVHFASGYGTMARLAGIDKLIVSVWGSDVYDFPYKSWLNMHIIQKNLLSAMKIASTSNCMAKQVKRLIGEAREIVITPFGVDVNLFKPDKRQNKSDYLTIGNIKTLSPKYGIDDLIKAFALVKEKYKKYSPAGKILRCVVYGEGEQRSEIERLVRELNLIKDVELPGEIPNCEVPNALKNIDIFCATSVLDSESFGVSVVEAEAMEIPVVASDVEGFREVVDDGVTGIIVEKRNVQEISAALLRLLLDNNLRKEMGINGRKRVLKLYNFDDNVTAMEELYRSII